MTIETIKYTGCYDVTVEMVREEFGETPMYTCTGCGEGYIGPRPRTGCCEKTEKETPVNTCVVCNTTLDSTFSDTCFDCFTNLDSEPTEAELHIELQYLAYMAEENEWLASFEA